MVLGFVPECCSAWPESPPETCVTVVFVKELLLNGAEWDCRDDVYTSFFRAVEAPDWHGRNFDALRDSIEIGQINNVEPPYRVIIQNYSQIGPGACQMASQFVDLLREIGSRGCPVEVVIKT